jgi:hypothetical protein
MTLEFRRVLKERYSRNYIRACKYRGYAAGYPNAHGAKWGKLLAPTLPLPVTSPRPGRRPKKPSFPGFPGQKGNRTPPAGPKVPRKIPEKMETFRKTNELKSRPATV